ncbi:MAG: hypothetical protein LQ341_004376 [Variospora aurantia]|nr:MAG: hypothetical protein LQ341_004376 [Variospora aurantia]
MVGIGTGSGGRLWIPRVCKEYEEIIAVTAIIVGAQRDFVSKPTASKARANDLPPAHSLLVFSITSHLLVHNDILIPPAGSSSSCLLVHVKLALPIMP